jgi:hypothetical protein
LQETALTDPPKVNLPQARRPRTPSPPALGFFLLAATLSRPLPAAESHCDPDLRSPKDDFYGYKLRGDRCEGIYVKDVAGRALQVVSLTESVEDFDPAVAKNLLVEWTAPGDAAVRLRALALRHGLYYQMDSTRPAGSASYSWPPNFLRELKLKKGELGLLAWTSQHAGNGERRVYVPLRISQQAAPTRSPSYKVVVRPGVALDDLFLSLAVVERDGRPGAFVLKDQPLKHGYYPAEEVIMISIPALLTPGVYYLEIGATLKAGGSSVVGLWFYHPRA